MGDLSFSAVLIPIPAARAVPISCGFAILAILIPKTFAITAIPILVWNLKELQFSSGYSSDSVGRIAHAYF